MKTTVFRSALMLLIASSLCPTRGVIAAEEEKPGDSSARKTPPGQRVQIPIKGVEFYARSIRLRGTTVMATGDLRARLASFPDVEVRAVRLEYRIGGDGVELHEPTWTHTVGDEGSWRLKVSAATATFRIQHETVTAKSVRLETQDGGLSFEAASGTWRSKSRECLLESVEGEVFTTTDKEGRGSPNGENFRVKVRQATVRLSPDLTLEEVRLDRVSGEERRSSYVFEAEGGVLDGFHVGRPGEARLKRVKVVGPGGQAIECDELSYRSPEARGEKKARRE